jgi:hypothetical protein
MSKITLRANWGSYCKVKRIFAFDSTSQTVSVLFESPYTGFSIDTIPLSELEAIDESGRYVDTLEQVQRRAGCTIDGVNALFAAAQFQEV